VDDFAALLDAHDCTGGDCSRWSHTQVVLVAPADVATVADELRLLAGVRNCLTARGLTMLETVPTPRFHPAGDDEPKPWPVRYVSALPGARGRPASRQGRFAALRDLFSQRWP
jgi:hypothetical protein